MSEHAISEAVYSSRLVQALVKVSRHVTREVIQRARQTGTPVIIEDEQGQLLKFDPEELAKKYGIDEPER